MTSQDGGDAPHSRDPAGGWIPVYLGLLGLALAWAWGLAWISGCDLPWACRSSGDIDPDRIGTMRDMLVSLAPDGDNP